MKRTGSRKQFEPHIQDDLFTSLVEALRKAHEALLTPPVRVQESPEKLKRWRPRVRTSVDWNLVLQSRLQTGVPRESHNQNILYKDIDEPLIESDAEDGSIEDAKLMEEVTAPLTIGLIGRLHCYFYDECAVHMCSSGQPNVGKSSLLNALFGETRVKASRTPGKVRPRPSVHVN